MDQLLNIYEKNSKQWQQFSQLTLTTIEEINNNIEQIEKKQTEIQNTIDSINTLSKHAQAQSLIKICPRAYVMATVKHTGEYNVEMNSDYQCTLTKDQTVEFLEEQLAEQNGILTNYIIQKEQLTKRLGFNVDEIDDIPDTRDMPEKIVTDKGIAFKQGPYYEIMEVEEDVPYTKNKKRICHDNRIINDISSLKIKDV